MGVPQTSHRVIPSTSQVYLPQMAVETVDVMYMLVAQET